ncbi:MAG: restriction endonuclease subunit S, partial [Arcobacteraceae bacterium]
MKNTQKLRFPEFLNDGEWEEKRLGDISDVRDGTHDSPKFYSSGKPLVTSKNLLSNGNLDINNVSLISEVDYEQINKRSLVNIGDILFGMIGTIGNPVRVKFDGFAIKNVALIKEKDMLLNEYLVHFLNSQYIATKFSILNTGNTQKFIALGQIRNLLLPIPKLPEQQKIANCLSSVDSLITAQSKKVETLKEHKKALMQQLFPSDGEEIPKLRFPEFKNAPKWEEKTLKELAENLDNKRVPITSNVRSKGDIPYYGASGIVDFVNDYIFDEELLCISEDGANLVARTYPIAFSISGKTWVNNHAHVLKFQNKCTQIIVENYLNSIKLDDFLTGMAQPKLNKAMLDIIPIPISSEPKEQQ